MAFAVQTRPNAIAEMNITPLVDVMLVLLIIFMVAAPMLTRSLSLNFPSIGPEQTPPPPHEIRLQILADGTLVWDGTPLSTTALDAVMRIEATREVAPLLQIEVDDDATYAQVAAVLGRARHAGIERIAIP